MCKTTTAGPVPQRLRQADGAAPAEDAAAHPDGAAGQHSVANNYSVAVLIGKPGCAVQYSATGELTHGLLNEAYAPFHAAVQHVERHGFEHVRFLALAQLIASRATRTR